MKDVVIAGVGIHPFGRFPAGYREIGEVAARGALSDAGVGIEDVGMVLVANVGAEMAKGHNIVDRIGRTGVPIVNVEAACASSGSALFLAAQMVGSGAAEVVLCIGVEKAPRGFIASSGFEQWQIENGLGVNPLYFAIQAQELMTATDVTADDLADVSVKNHRHAVHNPNAMYRTEVTREQVLGSKPICPPLTLLMLCAPNEGAAAVVLMSRREAERRGVAAPVVLAGLGLVSRSADDWFGRASAPGPRTSPWLTLALPSATSTSWSARTPTQVPSSSPTPTSVSARQVTRPLCSAAGPPRSGGGSRSTSRVGCSPRESRSGPPASGRSMSSWNRFEAGPVPARSREPGSGSATSWAPVTTPASWWCTDERDPV
jgi:hypothetical protein